MEKFRKDGVIIVIFNALLSPKWDLDIDEQVFIRFGTKELGSFRVNNVKIETGK